MPRRELSKDPKAISHRKAKQKWLAKKRGEDTLNERRETGRIYFFPYSQIDDLCCIYEGTMTTIGALPDEQFRAWYVGVLDAAQARLPKNQRLRDARKDCAQEVEFDRYARFHLLNLLYEVKAFRDTGVPFAWMADEAVSA